MEYPPPRQPGARGKMLAMLLRAVLLLLAASRARAETPDTTSFLEQCVAQGW